MDDKKQHQGDQKPGQHSGADEHKHQEQKRQQQNQPGQQGGGKHDDEHKDGARKPDQHKR